MTKLPEIGEMIPHGPECQNLDRLTDWAPGERAVAEWFAPGVRFHEGVNPLQMVEGLAQLSCIAAQLKVPESEEDIPRVLFAGIPEVYFRPVTNSNQSLRLTSRILEKTKRELTFEGIVENDYGDPVCEATIKGVTIPRRVFDRMVSEAKEAPDYVPIDPEEAQAGGRFISHYLLGGIRDQVGKSDNPFYRPHSANFRGHFPNGQEIFQGVQQVGLLGSIAKSNFDKTRLDSWVNSRGNASFYHRRESVIAGYRDVQFSSIVVPGQALTFQFDAPDVTEIEGVYAYTGTLSKSSGIVTCKATVLVA